MHLSCDPRHCEWDIPVIASDTAVTASEAKQSPAECVSSRRLLLPVALRSRSSQSHQAVGQVILQPVSATLPAASSPGTMFATVNTLAGSPCGGCIWPTKMPGISS